MNYESTKNNSHESETLSDDERKLSALLGGLKRVEAPKDFDFKLKARIAGAALTDERKPFLFPALRYVLPLCLVVMLSAFVALKIVAPGDEPSATSIAGNPQQSDNVEVAASQIQEKPSVEPTQANTNYVVDSDTQKSLKAPRPANAVKPTFVAGARPVKRGEVNSRVSSVGVRDSAVKAAPVINMNPNAPIIKNSNSGQSATISVRELLREIGIEVEFVGANWKITAVGENTPARIANMQIGDLIESIDDRKLSSDTGFQQSFTGKVFRIVRDGKQIMIDLTKK